MRRLRLIAGWLALFAALIATTVASGPGVAARVMEQPDAAVGVAVAQYSDRLEGCERLKRDDKRQLLAYAIQIAESSLRGSLEAAAEAVLYSISPTVVDVLGISVGPAQFKIGTARRYGWERGKYNLLATCQSFALVKEFLRAELASPESADEIRHAIMLYNGAKTNRIENRIYLEYVLRIYHHMRYSETHS